MRRLLLTLLFYALLENLHAQSVTAARKFLKSQETIAQNEIRKLAGIHSQFFGPEGRLPSSALSGFRKEIQKILPDGKDEIPGDYLKLRAAYAAFFHALNQHAAFLETSREISSPDSLIKTKDRILHSGNHVMEKASGIGKEASTFCILFRLDHPEDKTLIPGLINEEFNHLQHLFNIQQILYPVEEMEKACLRGYHPDSAHPPGRKSTELIQLINHQTGELKKLPACYGDHELKAAALNSLHFFSLEARNDLPGLEKFRESELEFIRLHPQVKDSETPDMESDKEYREAVKKYNEDIRAASELVRKLEKEREAHLQVYRQAQINFLNKRLTAFPE